MILSFGKTPIGRKYIITFGHIICEVHNCTGYKASRIEVLGHILYVLFWRRGVCNTSIVLGLILVREGVSVEKGKHAVQRPHIDRTVNQGGQRLWSGDQISFELSQMNETWPLV